MPDDPTQDPGEETAPFKVFETQDAFEAELQKRFDAGKRRGSKEGAASAMSSDDRAALDAYRQSEQEAENERLSAEGKFQEREGALQKQFQKDRDAWIADRDKLTGALSRERCSLALTRAATAAGAFNPNQIAAILGPRLALDPETYEPIVMDEAGAPALKAGGDAQTIEDLVSGYLGRDENKNLVRAGSNGKGSGAGGTDGSRDLEDAELAALFKKQDDLKTDAESARNKAVIAGQLVTLGRQIKERERVLASRRKAG